MLLVIVKFCFRLGKKFDQERTHREGTGGGAPDSEVLNIIKTVSM